MLVVSNTSPLSNLAIIGHLFLLRERYERVLLPPKVKEELDRLSHARGKIELQRAFADEWLVVEAVSDKELMSAFAERVDPGEAEAICLAKLLHADKLLLDDRHGRELAREQGIKVAGLLGELVHAKLNGRITSVGEQINRLRAEAHFFVREDIVALILSQAGE